MLEKSTAIDSFQEKGKNNPRKNPTTDRHWLAAIELFYGATGTADGKRFWGKEITRQSLDKQCQQGGNEETCPNFYVHPYYFSCF
jgi:hypothetical protein